MDIHSKQDLLNSSCQDLSDDSITINDDDISQLLSHLENWEISDGHKSISRLFKFKNYYQTIAFVNASAWIVHDEDHHPELNVTYNKCHVHFSTHSVNGLSIKDFICAAKHDELINRTG